jgi:hypothetical protein
MTALSRFAGTFTEMSGADIEPELLPWRLANACALVLQTDGAGLSVTSDLRVPLGASDEKSAIVERLQVTLGEGPCLAAHGSQAVVLADQDQMAASWPAFHEQVVSQTAFRSVASIPLRTPEVRLGALDLYWLDPLGSSRLVIADAREVATHVTRVLLGAPEVPSITGARAPAWIAAPAAQRRLDVWQAVGLLNAADGLAAPDALSVLRAFAYAHDTTLDDLATELVAGRTSTAAVMR